MISPAMSNEPYLTMIPTQNVWFNPSTSNSFVVLLSNSRVYGSLTGNLASYRKVAGSFATPNIKSIYEAEWAAETRESKAKKAAEAAARAEEQRQREQEMNRERLLKTAYTEWKDHCDTIFSPTATSKISVFPHLPIDICVCESEICWERKVSTELFACRHDVERFLTASGKYSMAWLKKERLAWHPDRFGRKCAENEKEAMVKKTTELYAIFEELIAAEAPPD
jgi:hypothetical protein